jgi:dolichol-phosphate mannosyltransferase
MVQEDTATSSETPEDEPSTLPARVSVIVPTYREAENLPHLVPAIDAALQSAALDGEIIIVDDDSQDGTELTVSNLAREHPVKLIVRRNERGLATAVIHGFRAARSEVLVCMDADGSHPAAAIPQLVSAIDDGADLAVGSRYVAGASTDEHWSLLRIANSKVATMLSRPLTTVRDPMSGFFAIARERFGAADALDPIGYKVGLELIVKCRCRRCVEVPIHFADRTRGESKLGPREIVNYVRHVLRLYRYRLRRS